MTNDILTHNTQWIAQTQPGGPVTASLVIKANPKWVSTVTNRMEPYKALPEKFRPILEDVADYFRTKAVPRTFSQEGPGWRPLSKRTQRERQAAGFSPEHPILVRTGDLYKELTEKAHPKHVETIKVGTLSRIIIGGSSEKYIRNQLGNTMLRIPSRPMIPGTSWKPLDPVDITQIERILRDGIEQVMNHSR